MNHRRAWIESDCEERGRIFSELNTILICRVWCGTELKYSKVIRYEESPIESYSAAAIRYSCHYSILWINWFSLAVSRLDTIDLRAAVYLDEPCSADYQAHSRRKLHWDSCFGLWKQARILKNVRFPANSVELKRIIRQHCQHIVLTVSYRRRGFALNVTNYFKLQMRLVCACSCTFTAFWSSADIHHPHRREGRI